MRHDVADDEDGGTAIDFFDQRGKIFERPDHGLRIRPRYPGEDANGHENLYAVMQTTFTQLWVVIVYCLAMVSLAYHLLHGFQSAFQTLGMNHKKYTPIIKMAGTAFSIIIPLIFAMMPILMHFGIIK